MDGFAAASARWRRLLTPAATALCVLVAAGLAAPAAAVTPGLPSILRAGSSVGAGWALHSPNGAYAATLRPGGRLVVTRGTALVWSSRVLGAHPRLVLRASGNVVITSGARLLWASATAGSRATVLVLGNDGALVLRSSGGTVWTSRVGNGCRQGSGKRVLIDLSRQFARLCDGSQQVLTTPITSGATALGDGTPTGTWRLQDKQRNRYLYPAAGGAYYVHYWMPYDGAYGMHDSSWQRFPYGSARYRTQGSHGCVHFPRAAIAWMYTWATIGTTVHITA